MGSKTQNGQIVIELLVGSILVISLLLLGFTLTEVIIQEQSNFRFQEKRTRR